METDNKVNTISIAMCTYNGSKYLAEQLDSIFRQTRQPDEIVICDDCSKDDTVELAKTLLNNWGGKYSLVQNKKNLGFVKNFEKAIGLCHGDIIFLSDQDDVWDVRKIDIMIQTFEKHPEAAMIFHDSELVDQNLNLLYPSFWKNTLDFDYQLFFKHDYKKLYAGNIVQGSASAIKKCVYQKAVPFPLDAFHDEWLALVALTIGEIVPVPQTLMKYRQGNNELGGMPRFSHTIINDLVRKMGKKYNEDINKYQRQLNALSSFIDCYEITNKNYPIDLIDYYDFLKNRIVSITSKKIKQVFLFKQYKKYYYNYKQCYLKDVFEILFRKKEKIKENKQ